MDLYSTIFEDNIGVLVLASTPKMTPHSKHIAIKCHAVQKGLVHIPPIEIDEHLADVLAKGL